MQLQQLWLFQVILFFVCFYLNWSQFACLRVKFCVFLWLCHAGLEWPVEASCCQVDRSFIHPSIHPESRKLKSNPKSQKPQALVASSTSPSQMLWRLFFWGALADIVGPLQVCLYIVFNIIEILRNCFLNGVGYLWLFIFNVRKHDSVLVLFYGLGRLSFIHLHHLSALKFIKKCLVLA